VTGQGLAPVAQDTKRPSAALQIVLAEIRKDKATRTPAYQENVQALFQTGQGAAYCRWRKAQLLPGRRQRAFLAYYSKDSDVVEIGNIHLNIPF
jgi:hypothetical protein